MSRVVYVGTLYAIQLQGEEPEQVARCVIGVDDELGIVQASDRQALARGDFFKAPRGKGKKCERLWYERRRTDYPRDRYWFHDLDDCRAYIGGALDKGNDIADREIEASAPRVVLVGQDVEICPEPGDFLCG
jgi:hypothetical protein